MTAQPHTRIRCLACQARNAIPTSSVDVVYLPDETIWMWATCPDCREPLRTDVTPDRTNGMRETIERMTRGGARRLDWSELDQRVTLPARPASIAEAMHMHMIGHVLGSEAVQTILHQAAVKCLVEDARRREHPSAGDT